MTTSLQGQQCVVYQFIVFIITGITIVNLIVFYKNISARDAVACGCDTDCDSGTAGSIVGAAVGDRGVPEYWTEPFNDTMRSYLCPIGSMKISDFVKRIASLREKRLSENG